MAGKNMRSLSVEKDPDKVTPSVKLQQTPEVTPELAYAFRVFYARTNR